MNKFILGSLVGILIATVVIFIFDADAHKQHIKQRKSYFADKVEPVAVLHVAADSTFTFEKFDSDKYQPKREIVLSDVWTRDQIRHMDQTYGTSKLQVSADSLVIYKVEVPLSKAEINEFISLSGGRSLDLQDVYIIFKQYGKTLREMTHAGGFSFRFYFPRKDVDNYTCILFDNTALLETWENPDFKWQYVAFFK